MKNKKETILIISIIVLLGLAGIYYLLTKKDYEKIDWTLSYENDSQQPYGTKYIYDLLKERIDTSANINAVEDFLHKVLNEPENDISNYVFIGDELYLTNQYFDSLILFVSKGNNAFISSEILPYYLIDTLTNYNCEDDFFGVYPQDKVFLTFKDFEQIESDTFGYSRVNEWEKLVYEWTYFEGITCSDSIYQLGSMDNEYPNFIKIPNGKGNFYFHGSPIAFSNFYIRESEGLAYAEKALEVLNKGSIFWDESSKSPFEYENNNTTQTPLKFILENRGLRWAWYAILIIALVFIAFRAKRTQRIIPVMLQPENASIEYTETIGALYYQQNDHKKLVKLKMKLFLEYIRNHYFLATHDLDEALIEKIIVKSQVAEANVRSIFSIFKRAEKVDEVSDDLLSNFHQAIQYFYNHCK